MQLAPPVLNGLPSTCIGQTGPDLITSLTPIALTGLTVTPGAGRYLVMLSASGSMSNKAYTGHSVININGVNQAATVRRIQKNNAGDETTLAAQCEAVVADGQVIEPRFYTDGGTFTLEERNFTIVRIGDG